MKTLRFGVDTGGTFTDLIVGGFETELPIFKRPTTPDDPVKGILDVFSTAADSLGLSMEELLGSGEHLIFGTTRATNAIVERSTARTALLLTEGHPDTLLLREGGGRPAMFDFTHEFYIPYVPRSLTFEVPERMDAQGEVVKALDEAATVDLLETVGTMGVEAVAVCLLWSIVNPEHELQLGQLIESVLPGVPFTLSHQLNPCIREYRRASSTAIDASLKPLMSRFYGDLAGALRDAGFSGRLFAMSSSGGVLDAQLVRATPIQSVGSGPAAAPVAGRYFAKLDARTDTAIVTDAGGTTFDVSVIRRGEIPWTRDTTVGEGRHRAITGFPSVDARSIGAGGGSIAFVDEGGLLHVGPRSAGASPGPACYAAGGVEPTVTDACLVLGYLDPANFLGGAVTLDASRAEAALDERVAKPLGVDVEGGAAAVLELAIEHMVDAIEQIALVQGIDPAQAAVVAGGGGGGLYSAAIAKRLGSPLIVFPPTSAGLSATGMILSGIQANFSETAVCSTEGFDFDRANDAIDRVTTAATRFVEQAGYTMDQAHTSLFVEARYPNQVWEIDVPLHVSRFDGHDDVARVCEAFDDQHEELFAFADRGSAIEIVAWRYHVTVGLEEGETLRGRQAEGDGTPAGSRRVRFAGIEKLEVPVYFSAGLPVGRSLKGPAIVESSLTTIVAPPGSTIERRPTGSLVLRSIPSEDATDAIER